MKIELHFSSFCYNIGFFLVVLYAFFLNGRIIYIWFLLHYVCGKLLAYIIIYELYFLGFPPATCWEKYLRVINIFLFEPDETWPTCKVYTYAYEKNRHNSCMNLHGTYFTMHYLMTLPCRPARLTTYHQWKLLWN